MISRGRKIVLVLIALIAIAGTAFLYLYYKPHRNVSLEKGIQVSADSLFEAFSSDEKLANTRYLDKALVVKGTIQELIINQQGQTVVVLKTADPVGAITATLLSPPGAKLQPGNTVKVKGFCSGFSTDVVLRDCILIEDRVKN